ncbi:hypothetical protein ACFVWF_28490 [Rhodococcus qingshengii]|uniref:hypothetical protein n=1 Tax=Rhodococcus qingshengii TaxID=334542 RepID=UPI0036D9A910
MLLEGTGFDQGLSAEALSEPAADSRLGASPVEGRHPLAVLSPGFTAPRVALTYLAEERVGRGCAVATVDHAHESFGTKFPDGRIATCVACAQFDSEALIDDVSRVRVADNALLLDRVAGANPAWEFADHIDSTRLGMAGRSIGGASTAATMAAENRVRAGINKDGSFDGAVPPEGWGDRPFGMTGSGDHAQHGETDPSWDESWNRLGAWEFWLNISGAEHTRVRDNLVVAEQLDVPGEAS